MRTAPRVKALGSRHSFDDVADTTGTHVVLDAYDDGRPPVEVDPSTGVASVAAGLRYGDVTRHVQAAGRALANQRCISGAWAETMKKSGPIDAAKR